MTDAPENNRTPRDAEHTTWRSLPTGVWAMGFSSLAMDTSSELIHSLLPTLMVTVLGASMVTVGFVEGMAEATAAFTKVFSGILSDRLGRRKILMVFGYALAAFTKPIFPLAGSIQWVFAARFIDRVGKGIRGAPRDALVADISPPQMRGAAYGLRQALDSVGALLGPSLAVALMILLSNNVRTVMWVAVVPAFICVALLITYVREPERMGTPATARTRLTLGDAKRLPRLYWVIVLLGSVFTLARFSEAFLILRAQDVGLKLGYLPTVMVAMNVFYAAGAYPAGVAADKVSQRTLLLLGITFLIAADLALAIASSPPLVFVGAALWGLHMALTQGLLSKLVADTTPTELRGTGFGIFNLISSGALLVASVTAGALWKSLGASAPFLAGAAIATIAAGGLLAAARMRVSREIVGR